MLVKEFKFTRNHDKGGFPWTAVSELERPGFYRGFCAVGKTLADVKEFAVLVRWCERTGMLDRLSEMHPPGFEKRMQTTWGGNWYPPYGGPIANEDPESLPASTPGGTPSPQNS